MALYNLQPSRTPECVRSELKLPYFRDLDALRFVAAMLVIVSHYFGPVYASLAKFNFGGLGVYVFFTLSGFLITRTLLSDATGDWSKDLKRFYIRRAFRIFPLYYLVLIAVLVLGLPGANAWFWAATYTTNIAVVNGWVDPGALGHFWTLAVEEQFYLFWPLVVCFVPRRFLTISAVVMIAIAPVYRYLSFDTETWPRPLQSTFACVDMLGIGALLAIAESKGALASAARLLRRALPVTVTGVVLLLCYGALDINNAALSASLPFLASLAFAYLIATVATKDGAIDRLPIISWLGKTSYAIYALHYPIGVMLLSGQATLARALLATAITLVASVLVYFAFEEPMRTFGRKLSNDGSKGILSNVRR